MPKKRKAARRSPARATVVPHVKVSGLMVTAKTPKSSARTKSALDHRSHRTAQDDTRLTAQDDTRLTAQDDTRLTAQDDRVADVPHASSQSFARQSRNPRESVPRRGRTPRGPATAGRVSVRDPDSPRRAVARAHRAGHVPRR